MTLKKGPPTKCQNDGKRYLEQMRFPRNVFEKIPLEAPEESESPADLASESHNISLIENMT